MKSERKSDKTNTYSFEIYVSKIICDAIDNVTYKFQLIKL